MILSILGPTETNWFKDMSQNQGESALISGDNHYSIILQRDI